MRLMGARVPYICPRCWEEGRLEKYYSGGRAYLRVVHGSGKNRRRCYLGPAEDYEHAGRLLLLPLRNLAEVDYVAVVEDAAETLLLQAERPRPGESAAKWLTRVRRLRETLERELERAKAVEKELERTARGETARQGGEVAVE